MTNFFKELWRKHRRGINSVLGISVSQKNWPLRWVLKSWSSSDWQGQRSIPNQGNVYRIKDMEELSMLWFHVTEWWKVRLEGTWRLNCEGHQAPRSQVLSSSWSLVGRKVIVHFRAIILDRAWIDWKAFFLIELKFTTLIILSVQLIGF